MTDWTETPTKNPRDGKLTADQVKIRRDAPTGSLFAGAFGQSWELVKQHPVETILLSFLTIIFSGGFPCGGGGGGGNGSGSDTEWESASQIGGSIGDTFDQIVTSMGLGGMEIALLALVIALGVMFGLLLFILGTAIKGGATIYWLRLVRGQSAQLGDTTQVLPFLVPLIFTTIIAALVIGFGFVLLIVPGIIAALGLFFLTQIIVDKNLGYVEGLKAAWRLTDGYKMDLLIFAILCGLLNLAGILACCVGLFVTNAVVMGATTIVYDRIAEPGNAYLEA